MRKSPRKEQCKEQLLEVIAHAASDIENDREMGGHIDVSESREHTKLLKKIYASLPDDKKLIMYHLAVAHLEARQAPALQPVSGDPAPVRPSGSGGCEPIPQQRRSGYCSEISLRHGSTALHPSRIRVR